MNLLVVLDKRELIHGGILMVENLLELSKLKQYDLKLTKKGWSERSGAKPLDNGF